MNDENIPAETRRRPLRPHRPVRGPLRRMVVDVAFHDPAKVAAARAEFIDEGFTFTPQPERSAGPEYPLVSWAQVSAYTRLDDVALIRKVHGIAADYGGYYDDGCHEV